jgi:hypothetical protein
VILAVSIAPTSPLAPPSPSDSAFVPPHPHPLCRSVLECAIVIEIVTVVVHDNTVIHFRVSSQLLWSVSILIKSRSSNSPKLGQCPATLVMYTSLGQSYGPPTAIDPMVCGGIVIVSFAHNGIFRGGSSSISDKAVRCFFQIDVLGYSLSPWSHLYDLRRPVL